MRNLFLGSREKQTWFDYGLDLLIILFIYTMGDKGFALFLLFTTLADVVVMAFFPDIEDSWWYKVITVLIAIFAIIYVGLALLGFARYIGVNLPL